MPTKSNNTGGRSGARPGSRREKKSLVEKVKAENPAGQMMPLLTQKTVKAQPIANKRHRDATVRLERRGPRQPWYV